MRDKIGSAASADSFGPIQFSRFGQREKKSVPRRINRSARLVSRESLESNRGDSAFDADRSKVSKA